LQLHTPSRRCQMSHDTYLDDKRDSGENGSFRAAFATPCCRW
jgi:hypothetical protein